MLIKQSKFLCSNVLKLAYFSFRGNSSSDGSIRSGGGKWAEMQDAHEREYFHKKNQEYLEYIRNELSKGRTMEDVIEDTKRKLARKERCKQKKAKGEDDDDDEDCQGLD